VVHDQYADSAIDLRFDHGGGPFLELRLGGENNRRSETCGCRENPPSGGHRCQAATARLRLPGLASRGVALWQQFRRSAARPASSFPTRLRTPRCTASITATTGVSWASAGIASGPARKPKTLRRRPSATRLAHSVAASSPRP